MGTVQLPAITVPLPPGNANTITRNHSRWIVEQLQELLSGLL